MFGGGEDRGGRRGGVATVVDVDVGVAGDEPAGVDLAHELAGWIEQVLADPKNEKAVNEL